VPGKWFTPEPISKGVLVLGATTILLAAANGVWRLSEPYAVHPIEPYLLNHVRIYRSGKWPFQPVDHPPLLWSPYPPTYEWLCSRLPLQPHPYFYGRLISVLSWLGLTAWLCCHVSRRTGNARAGILAAGVYAAAWPTWGWGFNFKMDSSGLLLTVLGLHLGIAEHRRFRALSLLLLALAWWTKPTFLAAPVAVAWSLWRRNPREAAAMSFSFALLCFLPILPFNHVTHGEFVRQVFLSHRGFDLAHGLDLLQRFVFRVLPLLLVLLWAKPRRTTGFQARTVPDFEPAFFLAAFVVLLLTVSYQRSSWNYLLEAHFALALLVGVWVGQARVSPGKQAWTTKLLTLYFLLMLPLLSRQTTLDYRKATVHKRDAIAVRNKLASAPPGTVLDLAVDSVRKAVVDDALVHLGRALWCEMRFVEPAHRNSTARALRPVARENAPVLFVTDSRKPNLNRVKGKEVSLWAEAAGFQMWQAGVLVDISNGTDRGH